METQNFSSPDWASILLQWVFFFALMTALFFPAFKFRNLAQEYSKKGWVYFIVGLTVGIVGFNLGHLVVFPLRQVVSQKYFVYLTLVLFLFRVHLLQVFL